MQVKTGSLTLEVEQFGEESNPAIILIAGLGFQLIDWPVSFCEALANAGYRVIRFDNRDMGLSDKLDHEGIPDLTAVMSEKITGGNPSVAYRLEDMASDTVGILDAFGIDKAHIIGMSMGGMIAQIIASIYSDRTLSLTSIMSSSSDMSLPGPGEDAASILSSAPQSDDIADVVEFGLKMNDAVGSPGFRWDRQELTEHIQACVRRCYCPSGLMRQYAAVMAAPSRRQLLKGITVPTLVIHGDADPFVQAACGQDVASHVPGARFEKVSQMGHDLSPSLCQHLVGLILPHIQKL